MQANEVEPTPSQNRHLLVWNSIWSFLFGMAVCVTMWMTLDLRHTVNGVIGEARRNAVDPANVAAQLRSRERVIINCETVSAIAVQLNVPHKDCPPEPTTTLAASRVGAK